MAGFRLFGPGHWAILAGTALLAAALVRFGQAQRGRPGAPGAARPTARAVARVMAAVMLAAYLLDPLTHYQQGELDWAHALPLQLCDAAGFAAIVALLTRRPLAFELAYFWALAGASQALLTPPFGPDPPTTLDAVRYFTLHAVIVATPLYLGPGLGLRPRRGAWWRVALLTMAYAAVVGAIDAALGANYMWLRESPQGSVLGRFRPWPLHIAAGAVLGWILFFLLDLPWRRGRRREAWAGEGAPAGDREGPAS